jgi:hypothetical protein
VNAANRTGRTLAATSRSQRGAPLVEPLARQRPVV